MMSVTVDTQSGAGRRNLMIFRTLRLNEDYMRTYPQNAQQDARHLAGGQRVNATTIIFIG